MSNVVQIDAHGKAAIDVKFANLDTVSAALDLEGMEMAALQIPAGFQGTTVSFQVAEKIDGTYQELDDSAGAQVVVTVAAGKTSLVPSTMARFLRFVKLVVSAQNASVVVRILRKQGGG